MSIFRRRAEPSSIMSRLDAVVEDQRRITRELDQALQDQREATAELDRAVQDLRAHRAGRDGGE